jgi:hypothetical protein
VGRGKSVKIALGGLGAVLLLAIAVIAASVLMGGPSSPAQGPPATTATPVSTPSDTPSTTIPPLSLGEANRLSSEIRSGNATRVKAAIVAPPEWTPSAKTLAQLAALRFAAVAGSLRESGEGIATVMYDVTDARGKHTKWQTTLKRVGAQWKLVITEDAR